MSSLLLHGYPPPKGSSTAGTGVTLVVLIVLVLAFVAHISLSTSHYSVIPPRHTPVMSVQRVPIFTDEEVKAQNKEGVPGQWKVRFCDLLISGRQSKYCNELP